MLAKKATPIVCDLRVFSQEEREEHIRLSEKVLGSNTGFFETEKALELYFGPSSSKEELTKWFLNESRCCPFLDFELEEKEKRFVLKIYSSKEGLEYFKSVLMSKRKETIKSQIDIKKGVGIFSVIAAGALCLACFAPLLFGYFSAEFVTRFLDLEKYMIPVFGVLLTGSWVLVSRWRKKRNPEKSSGCGC
ncbi:hypothetical protein [Leptospira sarikeiensis]|uniref:Uncharacterized protein n=1 Tax=Leptospira sarikeiensis TaxID=2484943 RepID=A0A4R9JZJ0_9LEPT|nr:hypothetical protein [Leptospira sarikeiensis]TGL57675.1 hypothetical protein EHQ64_20000 [Leptospira sarikeiensis]